LVGLVTIAAALVPLGTQIYGDVYPPASSVTPTVFPPLPTYIPQTCLAASSLDCDIVDLPEIGPSAPAGTLPSAGSPSSGGGSQSQQAPPEEVFVKSDDAATTLDRAFADAIVRHHIEEPVVAHVETTITIELDYDVSDEELTANPEQRARIAFWNIVSLRSGVHEEDGQEVLDFDIEQGPNGPVQKRFPNLEWEFDITPNSDGVMTLTALVQPVVYIDGVKQLDYDQTDEEIEISVDVHAKQAVPKELHEAALETQITASGGRVTGTNSVREIEVNEQVEYTAQLALPAGLIPKQVDLDLQLMFDPKGSEDASISRPVSQDVGGNVRRTWTVTPTSSGAVNLQFVITSTSKVGDDEIPTKTHKISQTLVAVEPAPPAPSFLAEATEQASQVEKLLLSIAAIATLIGVWWKKSSIGALWTKFRAPRKRLASTGADVSVTQEDVSPTDENPPGGSA
jgi:hypothetical protein